MRKNVEESLPNSDRAVLFADRQVEELRMRMEKAAGVEREVKTERPRLALRFYVKDEVIETILTVLRDQTSPCASRSIFIGGLLQRVNDYLLKENWQRKPVTNKEVRLVLDRSDIGNLRLEDRRIKGCRWIQHEWRLEDHSSSKYIQLQNIEKFWKSEMIFIERPKIRVLQHDVYQRFIDKFDFTKGDPMTLAKFSRRTTEIKGPEPFFSGGRGYYLGWQFQPRMDNPGAIYDGVGSLGVPTVKRESPF